MSLRIRSIASSAFFILSLVLIFSGFLYFCHLCFRDVVYFFQMHTQLVDRIAASIPGFIKHEIALQ